MPDIKLKDGSGIEQTYEGVDTITVPLADGTGVWTFGLIDEQLNLSDGNHHYYTFALGSPLYVEDYFKDNYILKRTDFSNLCDSNVTSNRELVFLFYMNEYIEDLSDLTFSWTGSNGRLNLNNLFNSCYNLKKLPNFNGTPNSIYANQTNGVFSYCYSLQDSELPKIYDFINCLNGYPQSSIFSGVYLTEFDGNEIQDYFNGFSGSYWSYQRFFNYLYNMRDLTLPANTISEITSSSYGLESYFHSMFMLSSLKFVTQEDDVPYDVKWKGQSFYVTGNKSYPYGHLNGSVVSGFYQYSGVDETHNIFYNLTSSEKKDLEVVQARYDALKDFDDWHSFDSTTITYGGKSGVNVSSLFSRFNHDSIVEFFNTLPDTSAYLAQAGGTNTLKLIRFQGDLTDGGGVSDLTPEEIAVATAKGWTVQIVDS